MTDTMFTPGPWEILHQDKERWDIIAMQLDPWRKLAVVSCAHTHLIQPKECEANATLISAAPDLYAALENCQQYVVAWQLEYGTKPKDDHADKTLRDIKNALAKARGET